MNRAVRGVPDLHLPDAIERGRGRLRLGRFVEEEVNLAVLAATLVDVIDRYFLVDNE